jgi:hypothetical protein
MKLLDNKHRVWIAPDIFVRGGSESLAIPPAADGEAEREAAFVVGKHLAIARGPNLEKLGSSLTLKTRGKEVNIPEPELARIAVKLSMQRKMNQPVLETSHDIDPMSSGAPDFFVGLNPAIVTAIMIGIDFPTRDFQCTGGMVLRIEDKKWLSTTSFTLD